MEIQKLLAIFPRLDLITPGMVDMPWNPTEALTFLYINSEYNIYKWSFPHFDFVFCFFIVGFSSWEDENILAAVLAESQKEYLEKLKKDTVKEKSCEEDSKS